MFVGPLLKTKCSSLPIWNHFCVLSPLFLKCDRMAAFRTKSYSYYSYCCSWLIMPQFDNKSSSEILHCTLVVPKYFSIMLKYSMTRGQKMLNGNLVNYKLNKRIKVFLNECASLAHWHRHICTLLKGILGMPRYKVMMLWQVNHRVTIPCKWSFDFMKSGRFHVKSSRFQNMSFCVMTKYRSFFRKTNHTTVHHTCRIICVETQITIFQSTCANVPVRHSFRKKLEWIFLLLHLLWNSATFEKKCSKLLQDFWCFFIIRSMRRLKYLVNYWWQTN